MSLSSFILSAKLNIELAPFWVDSSNFIVSAIPSRVGEPFRSDTLNWAASILLIYIRSVIELPIVMSSNNISPISVIQFASSSF